MTRDDKPEVVIMRRPANRELAAIYDRLAHWNAYAYEAARRARREKDNDR